jgi:hypothetical protein
MKNALLACMLVPLLFSSPGCTEKEPPVDNQAAFITGKVFPAQAAKQVWIWAGNDSLSTTVIDGSFSFPVKPETYTLVVTAHSPYRNAYLGNIEVGQHHALDVGEIILDRSER